MNAAKNFVEQESRPGLELVSIPHIAPVQFMIRNRAMKTLVLLMEVRYVRGGRKGFWEQKSAWEEFEIFL